MVALQRQMTPTTDGSATTYRVFVSLLGLAALAVLLQGLWAGVFLEKGDKGQNSITWVHVHARCGEVAIGLSALAAIWALVKLRHRVDLWFGAGTLTVLLIAEAYIGGLIADHGKLTLMIVHLPLAMALMALAVWLPLRARTRRAVDR